MIQVPQIEPISALVRDYLSIFAKLKDGPVFLAKRSKPAAVLVSVEDWAATARRLSQLEGLLEAKRILAAVDRGEMGTVSLEELKQLLAERRANAATVGD
jgi:prevent-host-death family protein